jgi:hypothetical protein
MPHPTLPPWLDGPKVAWTPPLSLLAAVVAILLCWWMSQLGGGG